MFFNLGQKLNVLHFLKIFFTFWNVLQHLVQSWRIFPSRPTRHPGPHTPSPSGPRAILVSKLMEATHKLRTQHIEPLSGPFCWYFDILDLIWELTFKETQSIDLIRELISKKLGYYEWTSLSFKLVLTVKAAQTKKHANELKSWLKISNFIVIYIRWLHFIITW